MRSLLQQAFDPDMAAWVMSQDWYDDPAVNGVCDLVLERIRNKLVKEANTRKAFATLMKRTWQPGESVDDFWIDIQRQVKYCGLKCREDIDQTLATLWIAIFRDHDAEKEFALRPEITAEECYQLAKGLEQMRLGRREPHPHVNVVRQSNYKRGKMGFVGRGGGAPAGRGRGGYSNSGQRPNGNQRSSGSDVSNMLCLNCGFDSHRNGVCPAAKQDCKVCRKVGHFARNCPHGDVNAVGGEEDQNVMVCNAVRFEDEEEVDNASSGQVRPPAASRCPPEVQMIGTPIVPMPVSKEDEEYASGNRCEVNHADRWHPGTLVGSYIDDDGVRICAILMDGTDDVWRKTKDSIIVCKQCVKGVWKPIRQPVNGRPKWLQ
jgi:hypothetical protein